MNIQDLAIIVFSTQEKRSNLPTIICKDGFEMSVQASRYHYSTPKENAKLFTEFEIGFPNKVEILLRGYADDKNNLTQTVYAYVPFTLINKVIKKHKGINLIATFNL